MRALLWLEDYNEESTTTHFNESLLILEKSIEENGNTHFNESLSKLEKAVHLSNDDGNEEDSKLEVHQTHQLLWINDRHFQDQTSTSSSTKIKM